MLVEHLRSAGFSVQLRHLPEERGDWQDNGHVCLRGEVGQRVLAKHSSFQSNSTLRAGLQEATQQLVAKVTAALA